MSPSPTLSGTNRVLPYRPIGHITRPYRSAAEAFDWPHQASFSDARVTGAIVLPVTRVYERLSAVSATLVTRGKATSTALHREKLSALYVDYREGTFMCPSVTASRFPVHRDRAACCSACYEATSH